MHSFGEAECPGQREIHIAQPESVQNVAASILNVSGRFARIRPFVPAGRHRHRVNTLRSFGPVRGGSWGLITVASDVIAVVTGILLLIGLWTPIAGAAVAILEFSIAALATRDPSIHLLLAAMGAGLAMLGPGAWSIDSRLFGRKRLDIPDRIRGR